MRKTMIFIIFLVTIFSINILFYFISEDYRFFLKKLKWDNIIEESIIIDNNKESDDSENLWELSTNELNRNWYIGLDKDNEKIFDLSDNSWKIKLKNKISLWKNYTDIIDLFSIYRIKKLEINSNLFDLTDEYPDNYFEYYSKDLTLYLFPTKTYSDIKDIFNILSTDWPFELNEVNNFWDKSFYINLDKDIEDRFIRIIISNKWIIFWLKIKKEEYSLIRDKLNKLKPVIKNNIKTETEIKLEIKPEQ